MINAQALLARPFPVLKQAYTEKDAILYALSLGYGSDPVDIEQIQYVYEKNLRVVPSLVAVMCSPGFWLADPSLGANTAMIVHAEHAIQFLKPLAPAGHLRGEMSVVDVIDRGVGKGAMIVSERLIMDDESNQLVARIVQHTLCRGDGGFSGVEPAPRSETLIAKVAGEAPADWVVDLPTLPQAALLYRLFADLNPLHADPVVAHQAGFDRPILHGLCTYGVVCRAVMQACIGGDASRMRSLAGKFTAPVMPGDNLRIEIWKDTQNPAQAAGQQNLKIRCSVPERQSVVFSNATASVSVP